MPQALRDLESGSARPEKTRAGREYPGPARALAGRTAGSGPEAAFARALHSPVGTLIQICRE